MSTCYFTYSWETDEKKAEHQNNLFSYIKKRIEDLSDDDVEVIYDKESFHEGDDFRKREAQLKDSDCVLVFFSSEYKRKVLSGECSGVAREYKMIKERAESNLGGVISILFSGDLDTAVTDEFKYIIQWDISKIKYQIQISREKTVLGDELSATIEKLARKAITEANAVAYCREHQYATPEDEYRALFLDSHVTPLPSDCIIRTTAHDNIINQSSGNVIGRKGSGKSTLLDTIQRSDPAYFLNNYKHLVSLNVEDLDINFVYDNLISKVQNDFNVINMSKVLDTFWEILFVLQGIVTIGFEIENYEITNEDKRYTIFNKVIKKLKNYLGLTYKHRFSSDLTFNAICHCSVELLANHIQHNVLDHACDETPLTGAYCSVDSLTILSNAFGPEPFKSFCLAVKKCNKKILLALDGFDTHSNDFRTTTNRIYANNSDEAWIRTNFEVRLFRELLVTVSTIKTGQISRQLQNFFSSVHFCVIIPQDRFDEIAKDDRDIIKRSCCNLNWDAFDLMEMLVKRLEHYYQMSVPDENAELCDRFYNIIREKMPNIPTEVEIDIDGHIQKMPLFNYLLRNSFWRPRDIIINFAIIMKQNKKSYNDDIIQCIIKKFLGTSADKIIEDEFLNEYKNVYLNLKEVLFRFKNTNMIQDYASFIDRLSRIHITSLSLENLESADNKLYLLYRLGVIGLYYEKGDEESKKYGYNICFVFNEGLEPIDKYLSDERKGVSAKVIFNPIFVKYLALNFNTKELICNYDWKYIKTNHALKDNIRRI